MPLDARKLTPAPPSKVTTVATLKRTKLPPALPAAPSAHVTAACRCSRSPPRRDDVPLPPAAKAKGGYMIQVGAFDDEQEAKQRLVTAKAKAKDQLIKADPFTEKVAKGRKSLYRARFAGLDRHSGGKRLQASQAQRHPLPDAQKLRINDLPLVSRRSAPATGAGPWQRHAPTEATDKNDNGIHVEPSRSR